MAFQCISCDSFTLSLKVNGSSVEVVDTVFESMVHKAVHCLLVHYVLVILVLGHRPSHAAVTEDADLVSLLGICPVCHFS